MNPQFSTSNVQLSKDRGAAERTAKLRCRTRSFNERRGAIPKRQASCPTIRRQHGDRAPRLQLGKGAYIRFCETNPFYFLLIFDGSTVFAGTCVVCSGVCKWVRSGKTNPIWGIFWVVFIEKWVRFRRTKSGRVATETSTPRSSPERNSGRAGRR